MCVCIYACVAVRCMHVVVGAHVRVHTFGSMQSVWGGDCERLGVDAETKEGPQGQFKNATHTHTHTHAGAASSTHLLPVGAGLPAILCIAQTGACLLPHQTSACLQSGSLQVGGGDLWKECGWRQAVVLQLPGLDRLWRFHVCVCVCVSMQHLYVHPLY